MHALRGVLGPDVFWEAYREYGRRWMYKHPQPYDLFNTFEDVAGRDLDWFWTSLLYTTWTLDHAIGQIEESDSNVIVTIADKGLTPMPAPVSVHYADGRVIVKTVPVDAWLSDQRSAQLQFPPGKVTRIVIDSEQYFPDVDRSNNLWESSAVSGAGG